MRITVKHVFGDELIIYAFGCDTLGETISNIYLAGDRVANKEIRNQFHSLSQRLLEGMPEDRWPEYFRRVQRNMGAFLNNKRQEEEENLEMMREWLRKKGRYPES